MDAIMKVNKVSTTPFEGQRPGTSGLRKATKVFLQEKYVHNFVQSYFNCIHDDLFKSEHKCIIVGGDGRYFSRQALKIIIAICAGNAVGHIFIGQNGLLSTPAISNLIRLKHAVGGIILTASHNPGGIDKDFGIKFNSANGGPAPEHVTEAIYYETTRCKEILLTDEFLPDLSIIGVNKFKIEHTLGSVSKFYLEIIDPIIDYLNLMKKIFDFELIRKLFEGDENREPFKLTIDAMDAVMGPYALRIFVGEFKLDKDLIRYSEPLMDFGGGHPDPNLTYAKRLVDFLKSDETIDMGAAFDGDGDRNMILGNGGYFVSPCDSVAVLADHLSIIPYFQQTGVKGVARSMPTSGALDIVANKHGLKCFETPTGWKYFGNLMDSGNCSLCGEESFGTGSDHIREKDGMWAVLFWLSIIADKSIKCNRKVTIKEIMNNHWRLYGRNFYTRYDYENCSSEAGAEIMRVLNEFVENKSTFGKKIKATDGTNYIVSKADNFSYTDPIDKSVSSNQGIRILFSDGSRIIYRLSGTGSSGATIRIYIDSYKQEVSIIFQDSQFILKPLIEIALNICNLTEITGRTNPDVIT